MRDSRAEKFANVEHFFEKMLPCVELHDLGRHALAVCARSFHDAKQGCFSYVFSSVLSLPTAPCEQRVDASVVIGPARVARAHGP